MIRKIGKILLVALFFINICSAKDIKVELNPPSPIVGENFQLVITVNTDSSNEPFVSFDPGGLEVLGRNVSKSIETTYINGNFSTLIKYQFTYDLVGYNSRTYRLTNIKIDDNGKQSKLPNKVVNLLKEPPRVKDYFLKAIASKTYVYKGEGIDVNYYLYTRVPILSRELKQYPKLNNFIKRFFMVQNENPERVNYGGRVFQRTLVYSARLYPEKIGTLYIDSLKMLLRIPYQRRSAFGFGFGPSKSTTVISPKIKIDVKSLPANDVPNNFTGLIGDHNITFKINKSKFVVNEIIEGKFEISGEGLLEKYEAPLLYSDDRLEKFDTKSEIVETNKKMVKKVFDFTFIPRDGLNLDQRELALSFFNPETQSYFEKKVTLPAISVSGSSKAVNTIQSEPASKPTEITQKVTAPSVKGLVGPIEKFDLKFYLFDLKKINIGLFLIILFVLFSNIDLKRTNDPRKEQIQLIIKNIKKNGVTYKSLYSLLSTYWGKELPPSDIIAKSNISKEAKNHFLELIKLSGHNEFSGARISKKFKVNYKYFKELLK